MKTLLILGAGTGGTMLANKMVKALDPQEWRVVVVDKDEAHVYQPGLLFVPFGIYTPGEVVKPKRHFLPPPIEFIPAEVEGIEPDQNRVKLKNGQELRYDVLVLATGTNIHPEQVEGLLGDGWRQNVFDFYTLEGSTALSKALRSWKGGKLVVHVAEMPIKCPVAPLEFVFLADAFFREHGLRDNVEITYATPLPGAFTKPRASAVLGSMMEERGIKVEPEFTVMEVDESARVLRSFDEREVPYDLLVDIPTNMGAEFVGASGMGDELNYLPVNKNTLQSERWENVWAIGDAGNAPASKAGATAHFMLETLVENILRQIDGLEPLPNFDGHANCFIESGNGKALLIDFNYDVEPLEGMFPLPGIGPLPLLRESPINHWGKLMFRWAYWNILMRGGDMPIESQMSMAGKKP